MPKKVLTTFVGGRVVRKEIEMKSYTVKLTLEDGGTVEFKYNTEAEMDACYREYLKTVGNSPVVAVEKQPILASTPHEFNDPFWEMEQALIGSFQSANAMRSNVNHFEEPSCEPTSDADNHCENPPFWVKDKCSSCQKEQTFLNILQPCNHFPFCGECIKKFHCGTEMFCPVCREMVNTTFIIQRVKLVQ